MGNTKSKKQHNISLERWITLASGAIAVIGWALLIVVNMPQCSAPENSKPVIQFLQLDRDAVTIGETIDAKVIVNDPDFPNDEIDYFWQAYRGRIGIQLDRFQGPQVSYVAPDQPGIDFIEVIINDRDGLTDKEYKVITITERRKKQVIVGNKNFTEQYIVGELMKQLLEYHDFSVILVSDLYSPDLRRRMEDGDIEICAEYTGTAWMVPLAHEYTPGMDNNKIYNLVKEEEAGNGFIWLKPIWNNNTYALASWSEFIEVHGLKTLSDLASLYRENEGEIKTYIDPPFATRPDGLPGLERHYNFIVAESSLLLGKPEASLLGLEERRCEVAMVFGTDAQIAEHGWYIYIDDKSFFPPYDLTPCIREEVLDKYPEIADILNELVTTFPGGGEPATPDIVAQCQKVWQELNAKVNIDGMEPDEVAREYLIEHGLIKG